eukprot:TRINITY_DN6897_c0_g1_i1.p1 TRINITY_DN6897_c0_g1~~TRINITY_DN6897_c0_g1_i1.p1  ORF type:complete len:516 (-),score=99.64 TRINITY_DN6897_c0_g1_i1:252-1799(-)
MQERKLVLSSEQQASRETNATAISSGTESQFTISGEFFRQISLLAVQPPSSMSPTLPVSNSQTIPPSTPSLHPATGAYISQLSPPLTALGQNQQTPPTSSKIIQNDEDPLVIWNRQSSRCRLDACVTPDPTSPQLFCWNCRSCIQANDLSQLLSHLHVSAEDLRAVHVRLLHLLMNLKIWRPEQVYCEHFALFVQCGIFFLAKNSTKLFPRDWKYGWQCLESCILASPRLTKPSALYDHICKHASAFFSSPSPSITVQTSISSSPSLPSSTNFSLIKQDQIVPHKAEELQKISDILLLKKGANREAVNKSFATLADSFVMENSWSILVYRKPKNYTLKFEGICCSPASNPIGVSILDILQDSMTVPFSLPRFSLLLLSSMRPTPHPGSSSSSSSIPITKSSTNELSSSSPKRFHLYPLVNNMQFHPELASVDEVFALLSLFILHRSKRNHNLLKKGVDLTEERENKRQRGNQQEKNPDFQEEGRSGYAEDDEEFFYISCWAWGFLTPRKISVAIF